MAMLSHRRSRSTRFVVTVTALSGALALGACSSSAPPPVTIALNTTAPGQPTTSAGQPAVPTFVPLNRAVGYGLLRLMTLDERPGALDVVIYQALPNEMPRVAGVITTVGQTPLSHVNLRAVQDKVPNAVAAKVLEDKAVTDLIGRYVKYTVTESGFTIEPTTQAEVEAHHASTRPTEQQTPQRDLSITTITPLSDVAFAKWTAFGVKAANVATLRSFAMPDVFVPDGYAVPFYFYDDFMRSNGLYERARTMLNDPKFRSDPAVQDSMLADFRDAIKGSPMPNSLMSALTGLQGSYPADTALRCRSSTNNEDLPSFSGAGLYDSFTQHPDEGHLSKCIQQVYASVWNLRAFLERDFYRIDHLVTAMGVLVYPHFDGEKANGVAVSADVVYETEDAFYVNTQVGEDLVTNPDESSIPEELLIYKDGTFAVIIHSSRVAPGETVLTPAQVELLKSSLTIIHDRFANLYQVKDGQKFAIEIEFKILSTGTMAIKQARTWIF
jgi:Pyruvate phosphate dikinase, AMP/ATP-binding domain